MAKKQTSSSSDASAKSGSLVSIGKTDEAVQGSILGTIETVDKSVILTWNGHTFKVNGSVLYSFNSLTIKGTAETEDKGSSYKYVSKKSGKPYEVSFTIVLNRLLGVENVMGEAKAWTQEARAGKSDYIYFAGQKLYECKFMLTEANVSDIEMMPDGTWISCEIKCVLKTSSKSDSAKKSSGSGSHKSSSKKKNSKKSKTNQSSDDGGVDAISGAAPKRSGNSSSAASYINGLVRRSRGRIKKKK